MSDIAVNEPKNLGSKKSLRKMYHMRTMRKRNAVFSEFTKPIVATLILMYDTYSSVFTPETKANWGSLKFSTIDLKVEIALKKNRVEVEIVSRRSPYSGIAHTLCSMEEEDQQQIIDWISAILNSNEKAREKSD